MPSAVISELSSEGYQRQEVMQIAKGYHMQLRRMEPEVAEKELLVAIRYLSQHYGARKALTPDLQAECVDLVMTQFGQLGVMELRLAYQMWAAGRIPGLEMYGGEFNATQLGRVLAGYVQYRRKVVAEVIRERDQRQAEYEREEVARQRRAHFREAFPVDVERWQQRWRMDKSDLSWQDIPVNWYEWGQEFELFEVTRQDKESVWFDSLVLAKVQIDNEVTGLMKSGRKEEARQHRKRYSDPDEIQRRAVVISKKKIVFAKLTTK